MITLVGRTEDDVGFYLAAIKQAGEDCALRGDFRGAAEQFRRAIGIAPEDTTSYFALSAVLDSAGEATAAREVAQVPSTPPARVLPPINMASQVRFVIVSPPITR